MTVEQLPVARAPPQADCLFAGYAYLEAMTVHFPFQNSYAALPANFFARVAPTPVTSPRLIKLNRPLAVQLGLDPDRLESPEGAEILAGKQVPDGADPIAMAYAGHQFGHFVPQLGDGRAILLGEVIDAGGVRRDIQLKGSGPTPFSRRGDGRGKSTMAGSRSPDRVPMTSPSSGVKPIEVSSDCPPFIAQAEQPFPR